MLPICSQQHHAHAQDDTWALHAFRTVRGKGAALQNPPPVIAAIPARTPPAPPGRAVLLEQGGCTWGAHRGADPGCNGIQPTACKCTGQQMQRSASAPRCWQLQGRWGSCNAQRMQLLQGNLQGVRHCRAEVKHSDRAARPTANPNANCSTSGMPPLLIPILLEPNCSEPTGKQTLPSLCSPCKVHGMARSCIHPCTVPCCGCSSNTHFRRKQWPSPPAFTTEPAAPTHLSDEGLNRCSWHLFLVTLTSLSNLQFRLLQVFVCVCILIPVEWVPPRAPTAPHHCHPGAHCPLCRACKTCSKTSTQSAAGTPKSSAGPSAPMALQPGAQSLSLISVINVRAPSWPGCGLTFPFWRNARQHRPNAGVMGDVGSFGGISSFVLVTCLQKEERSAKRKGDHLENHPWEGGKALLCAPKTAAGAQHRSWGAQSVMMGRR